MTTLATTFSGLWESPLQHSMYFMVLLEATTAQNDDSDSEDSEEMTTKMTTKPSPELEPAVSDYVSRQSTMLAEAQDAILIAQNAQKQQADKSRRPSPFNKALQNEFLNRGLISYKKTFDIEWTERHIVEFEEVIKEYEAEAIIKIQENTIEGVKTEETKTAKKSSKVIVEQIVEVKKDIIVEKDVQVNETVTKVTTGTATKEAVPKTASVGGTVKGPARDVAFGIVIVGAGAGAVASGTLHKVDGVWTRTAQVLNTRKGGADEKCPVGKHTLVYYDEEAYDSEIAEVPTGVRHITQLIYNSQNHVIRTVVNDVAESERLQDSRRRTMDMVSGLAQSAADALPLPSHDDIYYHHQRMNLLDENESDSVAERARRPEAKEQQKEALSGRDDVEKKSEGSSTERAAASYSRSVVRRSSRKSFINDSPSTDVVSQLSVQEVSRSSHTNDDEEEAPEWNIEDKELLESLGVDTRNHKQRQRSSDLETGSSIDTPVRKGMEPLTAFASSSKKND
ncbi:hypothetical protein B0O80DRAFT_530150 [Mortierella sp. GBAus27b]|nr:hypothetical protein B0O80DRAFT_530150 [Mortierella sp. GBAus27b]